MARMNVFIKAGNDNRDVSIGGRAQSNSGYAKINTDNATHHDTAVTVRAEVVGHGTSYQERRKKDGDQRKSVFYVDLPEQDDEYCEVNIGVGNSALKALAQMGMLLATVKGAQQLAEGDTDGGKYTLEKVGELIEMMDKESKGKGLNNVFLPGGVSLAHALNCVRIVEGLRNKPASEN